MKTALIVVDFQHDFISGSLAVPGAADYDFNKKVALTVEGAMAQGDRVVYTRDWHPANHCSFAEEPEFRDGSWPAHCVMGTSGAEIALQFMPDLIVSKGMDPTREAYSGFGGDVDLTGWLHWRDVDRVEIIGLATDYCVKHTAIDAATAGFHTVVRIESCRGVGDVDRAIEDMRHAGAAVA